MFPATDAVPFTVVIPARYQSSRLPGKPLRHIGGRPMIEHVVERARLSAARAVYVATDDERIEQACLRAGVQVVMTSPAHASGTDRIEEASRMLKLGEDEVVVNVQGDEPLIPPSVINQVARNMTRHAAAGICTLYETLRDPEGFRSSDVVKVVTDARDMALYFSRAPIPWPRDAGEAELAGDAPLCKRHVGIYAYRVGILRQFVAWPASPLEQLEKLEQLRALHHGVSIHVELCGEAIPAGVDTEADLELVREIIKTC